MRILLLKFKGFDIWIRAVPIVRRVVLFTVFFIFFWGRGQIGGFTWLLELSERGDSDIEAHFSHATGNFDSL